MVSFSFVDSEYEEFIRALNFVLARSHSIFPGDQNRVQNYDYPSTFGFTRCGFEKLGLIWNEIGKRYLRNSTS